MYRHHTQKQWSPAQVKTKHADGYTLYVCNEDGDGENYLREQKHLSEEGLGKYYNMKLATSEEIKELRLSGFALLTEAIGEKSLPDRFKAPEYFT